MAAQILKSAIWITWIHIIEELFLSSIVDVSSVAGFLGTGLMDIEKGRVMYIIDVAIMYKEQLQRKFQGIWFIDKYKYWNFDNYYQDFVPDTESWNRHQFVSVNKNGEILGYIGYSVDRQSHMAYGLNIINFTDDKITFGIDLGQALIDIFDKFKFRKLRFSVIVGNPVEKSYDKMVQKYGGRIVGIYYKEQQLIDGEIYDQKLYEILRENYLNNKK